MIIIIMGVHLYERLYQVSGNQPWYYFPSDACWNLLLCCVRRRTEPLPMIHEQRTSSRFGEISEPHCHQKSWNIHCGNDDRIHKAPVKSIYITFQLFFMFLKIVIIKSVIAKMFSNFLVAVIMSRLCATLSCSNNIHIMSRMVGTTLC